MITEIQTCQEQMTDHPVFTFQKGPEVKSLLGSKVNFVVGIGAAILIILKKYLDGVVICSTNVSSVVC